LGACDTSATVTASFARAIRLRLGQNTGVRFWLSHRRDVSLRDQLVAQIRLAILSGDLAAGARLPSTRQLARRFHVHANTISAAYRQLETLGWLESRRGSGVFVRNRQPNGSGAELDRAIAELFRVARATGTPMAELRARVRHWLAAQPPDHFLLIEPVKELREIVLSEIDQAISFPARGCDVRGATAARLAGAVPLVLVSKAEIVREQLPEVECLPLRLRSVPQSLAQWLPAKKDALVAVCSSWPDFLRWARTLLVAAGFDPNAIFLCDARRRGWEKSLASASAVVCDQLTARRVRTKGRVIPFALLADATIAELRQYVEFLERPFAVKQKAVQQKAGKEKPQRGR
jgi:DNA-binding transcriptional regulator YhcF (GntR family)